MYWGPRLNLGNGHEREPQQFPGARLGPRNGNGGRLISIIGSRPRFSRHGLHCRSPRHRRKDGESLAVLLKRPRGDTRETQWWPLVDAAIKGSNRPFHRDSRSTDLEEGGFPGWIQTDTQSRLDPTGDPPIETGSPSQGKVEAASRDPAKEGLQLVG